MPGTLPGGHGASMMSFHPFRPPAHQGVPGTRPVSAFKVRILGNPSDPGKRGQLAASRGLKAGHPGIKINDE